VIIDYSKNFWTYNRSTKQLVKDTSVPSVPFSGFIRSFAIGKDGTYWLADGNSPYAVYRRQGSQWVQVTGLSDCSSSCNPATIAVGPDGGVYATSESGKLYRYDTALKRFVMLTLSLPGRLQFIGVDASNHFWAVSGDTSKIYEYTGTAWVSRNDSLVTSPDSCIDQTIKCFSIGANGSIYTVTSSGTNQLARWNATSRVWERISSSPTIAFSSNTYAVGPDGRPWVLTQGSPDVLHQVR
jgi:streptogramin lyase